MMLATISPSGLEGRCEKEKGIKNEQCLRIESVVTRIGNKRQTFSHH